MKRQSWKPSKEKLDIIKIELGNEAAQIFHDKYRVAKERCDNPNCKDYLKYKGLFKFKDFVDFFNHCYPIFKESYKKYGNNISIDRINGDKGYEPNNIRFVPMDLNLKNKKIVIKTRVLDTFTNKTYEFDTFGEAKTFLNGSGSMFKALKKGYLYRNRYLITPIKDK